MVQLRQLCKIQTTETEIESGSVFLRAVLKMLVHWRTAQMLRIIPSLRRVPIKNLRYSLANVVLLDSQLLMPLGIFQLSNLAHQARRHQVIVFKQLPNCRKSTVPEESLHSRKQYNSSDVFIVWWGQGRYVFRAWRGYCTGWVVDRADYYLAENQYYGLLGSGLGHIWAFICGSACFLFIFIFARIHCIKISRKPCLIIIPHP